MIADLKGHPERWGLAAASAFAGLAAWYALNLLMTHKVGGQTELGWPGSWLESVLLMPAFVAGLVAMMVPCVLQMSIVFAAVTAGVSASDPRMETGGRLRSGTLAQTGMFILGYVAFYSTLGAGLGVIGQGLALQGDVFLSAMRGIGGLMMVALGLHLGGLLRLPLASFCRGPVGFLLGIEPKGRLGSVRAGIAFAIYCAGCCGPYIFAVLAMAASSGSVFLSISFLLLFSLGMAIPFFLIAVSHQLARRYLEDNSKRMSTVARISGTVLIVFGVMMALASGSLHGS